MSIRQYHNHSRDWRRNHYVYPVISRRSGGLSIGVNLNPDTACNFDCVYCQVDRSHPPLVRDVDPDRLRDELAEMIADVQNEGLFADPAFVDVPRPLRKLRDIAFSGDGEPTTCKHFLRCVELAARAKQDAGLKDVKIVLITDACYLTRPDVVAGLALLDENQGEVWAKLDAGTETYYREVNRPNFSLQHVIDNIIAASSCRGVVIQSLFMRLHDQAPCEAELSAYTDRLNDITRSGGHIDSVQVYTVARKPAEHFVTSLSESEVDRIVALVRKRTGLPAAAFYGES